MTDQPFQPLADLTLAACQPLVGQEFVRPNPDGPDVVLVLTKAERARRDPTADLEADRPFVLEFQGPVDPQLSQGMHDLENPSLPLPGVFLVPIDGAVGSAWYEAVFA